MRIGLPSSLPLEVWFEILRFFARHVLVKSVIAIGSRQMTEIIQPFLDRRERISMAKLGLDWDWKGNAYLYHSHGDIDESLPIPSVPLASNIEHFLGLDIGNRHLLDETTEEFSARMQPLVQFLTKVQSLLVNVNFSIIHLIPEDLMGFSGYILLNFLKNTDRFRRFIDLLFPWIINFNSIRGINFELFAIIHLNHYDKTLANVNYLEFGEFNISALANGVQMLWNWLNSKRENGEPRLLFINLRDIDAFDEFAVAIKERFMTSSMACGFYIRAGIKWLNEFPAGDLFGDQDRKKYMLKEPSNETFKCLAMRKVYSKNYGIIRQEVGNNNDSKNWNTNYASWSMMKKFPEEFRNEQRVLLNHFTANSSGNKKNQIIEISLNHFTTTSDIKIDISGLNIYCIPRQSDSVQQKFTLPPTDIGSYS